MKRTTARRTRILAKHHYVRWRLTDELDAPATAQDGDDDTAELSDEAIWYLLSLDGAQFDVAMRLVAGV